MAAQMVCPSMTSRAQSYPSKPVRLISSLAAGGMSDTFIRTVPSWRPKTSANPSSWENWPGASGVLGAVAMAQIPKGDGIMCRCSR